MCKRSFAVNIDTHGFDRNINAEAIRNAIWELIPSAKLNSIDVLDVTIPDKIIGNKKGSAKLPRKVKLKSKSKL